MIEVLNWIDGHGWTTFWLVVGMTSIVGAFGAAIGKARGG